MLKPTIARAQEEILADMADGIVPSDVRSFAQLHDYVDANGYGGAFEEGCTIERVSFWDAVQDELHQWLQSRGN